MASQVGAFDVVHHGWASVPYSFREDKKFEITSKQKLNELAQKVGLHPDCVSNILNAVDLTQRKLILVYCVTPGSGTDHGVKKIERVASAIHVYICSFGFPGGLGTCAMGGHIVVLSAPKDIKEAIVTECVELDVKQEPEYAGLSSEATDAKLRAVTDAFERDIDFHLYRGNLTEEQVRGQKWFTDLIPTRQALALSKLSAYREIAQFEAAKYTAYEAVAARLCGRSF